MYKNYILDKDYFIQVVKDLAVMAEVERDYLTKLDSLIGDSDHGINLSIGFREVTKKLPEWENENITAFFKKVGMTLLGKVGGAAGPLYGGFFMKLGEPANNKEEVDFGEFCNMIKNGVEAVESRGKAIIADKTMVDTFRPALDALMAAVEAGQQPLDAFDKCVKAGEIGRDSTIPLIAKKGRALRLGERAIGHMDPGSASSYMILNIFYENMKKRF
ncbi:MAG: dihydroxyacetone kinase subunit L [Firmicutes bacterium HGW-Firmicutes-7]|nr:MAG: dihydroxyacetone kinase subunit L [Firmicutes bacterium HGW-Firmicutes-7]